MKKCLFAVALLSLALAGGCAKGGNGVPPVVPTVSVTPNDTTPGEIYPGQTVTLTAATTDPAYAAVTWSETGSGWTLVSTSPPDAATKTSGGNHRQQRLLQMLHLRSRLGAGCATLSRRVRSYPRLQRPRRQSGRVARRIPLALEACHQVLHLGQCRYLARRRRHL